MHYTKRGADDAPNLLQIQEILEHLKNQWHLETALSPSQQTKKEPIQLQQRVYPDSLTDECHLKGRFKLYGGLANLTNHSP